MTLPVLATSESHDHVLFPPLQRTILEHVGW